MVVNENCSLLKYAEIGTLIGVIATGQGILEGWIAAYTPITAPVGYIAGKVLNPSLLPLPLLPPQKKRKPVITEKIPQKDFLPLQFYINSKKSKPR